MAKPGEKGAAKPKKIDLAHSRSGEFKEVYADVAMVRIAGGIVNLTLATDDPIIESEGAEIVEGVGYRISGDPKTTPNRTQQALIRMTPPNAATMALLVLEHLADNLPSALKTVGLQIRDKDDD